jgi:hypothetical protein
MPCEGTHTANKEDYYDSALFALIIGANKLVSSKIKFNTSNGGHTLTIYVEEDVIGKLQFPVNTDNDNNKLTLVNVSVYEQNNYNDTPLIVPGLDEILAHVYNTSNFQGYVNEKKIHYPFSKIFHSRLTQEDLSVPELTDLLTGLTAYTQDTFNVKKIYKITLSNACVGCPAYKCADSICN